jgi:hypothetical protein
VLANRPNGKNPRCVINFWMTDFHCGIVFNVYLLKSELLFQNSHHVDYVSFYLSRWYAKRFLHPDIVAPYDYIFIWDEDLGVEHFNAEE